MIAPRSDGVWRILADLVGMGGISQMEVSDKILQTITRYGIRCFGIMLVDWHTLLYIIYMYIFNYVLSME